MCKYDTQHENALLRSFLEYVHVCLFCKNQLEINLNLMKILFQDIVYMLSS